MSLVAAVRSPGRRLRTIAEVPVGGTHIVRDLPDAHAEQIGTYRSAVPRIAPSDNRKRQRTRPRRIAGVLPCLSARSRPASSTTQPKSSTDVASVIDPKHRGGSLVLVIRYRTR